MTIRRLQQITDLLENQFYDEFDSELEKPLLEASRIVVQELTNLVSAKKLPFEVLTIYTELVSLYLNVSLMACLKANREVAALTRVMIEGAIILTQLLNDKDGTFLEELEANRLNSMRLLDNVQIQYEHITSGQIALMKFDRMSMEEDVKEGLERIRQGESPLARHRKINERIEEYKDGQFYWLWILCSNYLHFGDYYDREDMSENIQHLARKLFTQIVEDCAASLEIDVGGKLKKFKETEFYRFQATNYGLDIMHFNTVVGTLSDIFRDQDIYSGALSQTKYKMRIRFPGNLSARNVVEPGQEHLINHSVLESVWNKLKSGKLRTENISSDMTSRDIIATAFSALPYVEILDEDGSQFVVADGEKGFLFDINVKAQIIITEKITALFEKGIFPMKCESGCDNEDNHFRAVSYESGYVICPICKSEKIVNFDRLLVGD